MLKSFRYLLFPISLIYGSIIWLRNKLFDINIFKSASFNFPLICVGNLAVGGTGKTPMTEYLVELLQHKYPIATLSRGYKRKTQGFAIANENSTALEIGDEPMQFYQKFPGVTVSVGEERLVAIPQLLHERPDTRVIILDDAFQHRAVKAGLNILLTEHGNLFTRDLLMPAGDLRDIKQSSKRADIIVVTKCKQGINAAEKDKVIRELRSSHKQHFFFTEVVYGTPYHIFNRTRLSIGPESTCLLVCGIANPKHLMDYLTSHIKSYDMIRYADHHIFSSDDLKDLKKQFGKLTGNGKIVITTEKDAVRLYKYRSDLEDFPLYVLPIRHRFLFDGEAGFAAEVLNFVNNFPNSKQDIES